MINTTPQALPLGQLGVVWNCKVAGYRFVKVDTVKWFNLAVI